MMEGRVECGEWPPTCISTSAPAASTIPPSRTSEASILISAMSFTNTAHRSPYTPHTPAPRNNHAVSSETMNTFAVLMPLFRYSQALSSSHRTTTPPDTPYTPCTTQAVGGCNRTNGGRIGAATKRHHTHTQEVTLDRLASHARVQVFEPSTCVCGTCYGGREDALTSVFSRTCLSSVVFPAPRKPESRVHGSFPLRLTPDMVDRAVVVVTADFISTYFVHTFGEGSCCRS
jgi:hypothetical protein